MPFAGECSPVARTRTLLVLYGCLGFLLCAASSSLQAADLEETRQQFIQGQYSNCIHGCEQAIADQEYNEDWRLLLIQSMMTLGRYTNALSVLTTNLERYSSSLPLRLAGREVFCFNNQKEKADALLQEV